MRILVVSDSHGKNDDVKQVIDQVGHIDMLIHLGDVEGGAAAIRQWAGCECHIIAGNNDYDGSLPQQEAIEIEGKRIFLTHGHRFYVGSGVGMLREYALDNGYDIVMFGHTHMPYLERGEEVTILNPGSLSYPRQDGRQKTFMIVEVDDKGEFHYSKGLVKSCLEKMYKDLFH